jgi:tetraacyldisaccharide 4'-kinase
MVREPAFWWREAGFAAHALAPVAAVYGAIARARLDRRGHRPGVPVICVGNLTVGGAGKTPTALAAASMLKRAGEIPVFLTRGFGGTLAGPVEIDPARHTADEVGDEAPLLAQEAPTILARNRPEGARAAIAKGATVIVMDDGFQNPSLRKDACVVVVDPLRGVGNGYVLPAGPMRAPLASQLARADAIVLVGTGMPGGVVWRQAQEHSVPVLRAHMRPSPNFIRSLSGRRVLAFAGIGNPQKFFATLTDAGVAVAMTRSFPDHHVFSLIEAQNLLRDSAREGLVLVTTEKDAARLRGRVALTQLAARARALPACLVFDEEDSFRSFLLAATERARSCRVV